MAQHDDLIINDQTGSDFLPDLNSILTAILTQNSGNDEPPVKVPFMYWAETDADTLWQRNAANDGWINRGPLASGFGALALLNTVGTSQIADNAVTLGKLAGGAAGKYLGFDVSGDPAELAPPSGGVFTESYESPEQTMTAAGSLTLAHGLSVRPKLFKAYYVCETAQHGYAVGDEADTSFYTTSYDASIGPVIIADATNVMVKFGNFASGIPITNKSTGAQALMTYSYWKLIVRAWA
ncbi:hypothetical protein [Kiloniella majae]|uniref:hypothetical protein n=1 Tax=Kiloniella majae TaxID=1938558 RepID=UPI000A277A06|nr:hypothetical protein [Kiloniella majae]